MSTGSIEVVKKTRQGALVPKDAQKQCFSMLQSYIQLSGTFYTENSARILPLILSKISLRGKNQISIVLSKSSHLVESFKHRKYCKHSSHTKVRGSLTENSPDNPSFDLILLQIYICIYIYIYICVSKVSCKYKLFFDSLNFMLHAGVTVYRGNFLRSIDWQLHFGDTSGRSSVGLSHLGGQFEKKLYD